MSVRRFVTCIATLAVLGGLLAAPSALAVSRPGSTVKTVGTVVWLTKSQAVKIGTAHSDGSMTAVSTIGPLTTPTGKQRVQISDLVASGDGHWVAWSEALLSHGGDLLKNVLAISQEPSGNTFHLTTQQAPIGFAGDSLVTFAGTTKRLDLQPTPHFVPVHSEFPVGTYAHGVIDTKTLSAPKGPSQTWRLRLTSFGGAHATLHNYVLAPTNYRNPDAAWTSADGKHVVVERGNHQDFGGLGPSSLADEFSLSGKHHRATLGHYGTDHAAWRIASVSFAGASDSVWAVWERLTKTGATGVVTHHGHGTWAPIVAHGIAVAGNAEGYVIAQAGKFVQINHFAEGFNTVPTQPATLRHGLSVVPMQAEGSAFAWVA
jgi:hypothetical protein